jgi:hypothetical protein
MSSQTDQSRNTDYAPVPETSSQGCDKPSAAHNGDSTPCRVLSFSSRLSMGSSSGGSSSDDEPSKLVTSESKIESCQALRTAQQEDEAGQGVQVQVHVEQQGQVEQSPAAADVSDLLFHPLQWKPLRHVVSCNCKDAYCTARKKELRETAVQARAGQPPVLVSPRVIGPASSPELTCALGTRAGSLWLMKKRHPSQVPTLVMHCP